MVSVSEYSLFRFQMRSDMPSVNKSEVKEAWINAEVIFDETHGEREERYSQEYGVIMISIDGRLSTVLRGDLGGGLERHEFCEWCGRRLDLLEVCWKCNGWKLK